MSFKAWDIQIQRDLSLAGWAVHIVENNFNQESKLWTGLNPDCVKNPVSRGVWAPPTAFLPYGFAEDFLNELQNALRDVQKPQQESYLQGKLDGAERHLEDMRKLVFKVNRK